MSKQIWKNEFCTINYYTCVAVLILKTVAQFIFIKIFECKHFGMNARTLYSLFLMKICGGFLLILLAFSAVFISIERDTNERINTAMIFHWIDPIMILLNDAYICIAFTTEQLPLRCGLFKSESLAMKQHIFLDLYDNVDPCWKFVERIAYQTWIYNEQLGRDAINLPHAGIKIKQVFEINNNALIQNYKEGERYGNISTLRQHTIIGSILTRKINHVTNQNGVYCHHVTGNGREQLRGTEVYLFHGTPMWNVRDIVEKGFDLNMAQNMPFGEGIYLAESSQKADQYTGRNHI